MAIGSLLTVQEAAEIIGVNPSRISHFIKEGRLKPARRLGAMPLFERADVRQFAKKKRPNGRPKENRKTRGSAIAKPK